MRAKTHQLKGFLLLEASIALLIACFSVELLFLSVGETQEIMAKQALKVDRAYAAYIFATTDRTRLLVHDHDYSKTTIFVKVGPRLVPNFRVDIE